MFISVGYKMYLEKELRFGVRVPLQGTLVTGELPAFIKLGRL